MNDTGIVVNGVVNEANLPALLKNVLKDTPDFIPELEKSFKTCAAKVEKHQLQMMEKMKNRPTKTSNQEVNNRMHMPPPCTPKNSHLLSCVFTETFSNCPAKYWIKSKDCDDLRNHMKNCRPKMMGNSKENSSASVSSEEKM